MDRRSFDCALGAVLIAAGARCGGGGSVGSGSPGDAPDLEQPAGIPWDLGLLLLVSGGEAIDLRATLPPGVPADGRFRFAGRGASAPPGIVLSPSGLLRATPAAPTGTLRDVIFEYNYV